MPVYQYQGKHYDLPEGLSPEQAKAKIQTHLSGEQSSELGEKSKGLGEAALTVGSGGLGMVAGLVPAGLDALNDLTQGKPADFENKYASAIDRMTYAPRTEKGQEYAEGAGDFINRNLVPLAPLIGPEMMPLGTAVHAAAARGKGMFKTERAAPVTRGVDPTALIAKLEAEEDRPQLNSRRPGTQGSLFPESKEGLASPYDAGTAGTTEPIAPQRQARQMGFNFGESPNIAVDNAGVARTGLEDPGLVQSVQQHQADMPGINAMNETAFQLQPKETPFNNPPPADAMAWMAKQIEERTGHKASAEELAQMWKEQAMGKDRQAAAQAAVDQRNAALQGDVARNVDLNEHGLDHTTLTPDHELTQTGREGMEQVQTAAQGARTLDKTTDALGRDPQGARAAQVGPEAAPRDIIGNQLLDHMVNDKVENHPLVRKAVERVTKQEELLIKVAGMAQEGRATASQLARVQKELESLKASLERTQINVQRAVKDGTSARPFNFKKQGGAVNPAVFKEGFEKLKQLADGTWLRAHNDGQMLHVEAIKDGHKLGHTTFSPEYIGRHTDERNLKAAMTHVKPEHRGKGYAEEMYKFASDLGNDVQKSDTLTDAGKQMWNKFESKGIAKNGMLNKQRGAIDMGPGKEPERKILDNIPGIQGTLKGLAPSKWTPEQAIEAARMGKDLDQNAMQKLSNWFTKGGQYMVDRSDNNPVIHYGVEKVQEAERKTRADVANLLHDKDFGLGAATRNMSAAEQTNIWALKSWADANQKELTPALLREHGATEAQIKYAETHKQVMDHAHDQMNKVWEALGKGSVTKRSAYAAMNASGDYRRLVYNHEGDVVGMVGSDLRWRVNGLKSELEKRGYTVGEEKYVGAKSREMGNAQAEMQQMLEFFAKDDPRVEELLQTVGDITSSMASKFMNMEVHTKAKKGIFGMDGRKVVGEGADKFQWGGTFLDRNKALANAREGLKAQMNYAEMAIKWGHLTDAIQDVKKVLTDKEVNEKQPMAKQWTQDYISKALGANPTFGRHLEEWAGKAMGETGIGFSNVRGAIATSRRIVNTVLLGLNPGFWATNVIQPFQAMPGMKALLTSKGLKADFDLGTGWIYFGKGGLDSYEVFRNPGKLTGVLKDAFEYAQENHVYGSDLIEHSNHVAKDLSFHTERISSSASGKIEIITRAPVYYGFVRMLGENGMTKENGLFEAAHNLTDMTMNNYSRTERPKAYDAMGPVGELASNLASYKHNELSRLAMFAREAGDLNARPLITHLVATVLASGVKGVVGYNALDWLLKQVSEAAGHPTSLTKELMAFSEWAGGKIAPHVLSHGLFSLMGVDMANRLGMGDALTPSVFPGGSKLVDIASAAGSAAYHRDEAHTKELAREVAPGVATGPMDLTMFSKGNLSSRRSDLAGSVVRNKTDKYAKAVGFTGIHESVEKQKLYENKWVDSAYTDIRKNVSNTMKGEIYMNGAPTAKSIQKYMDARGDVGSLLKEIDRIGKEQNMSAKDRGMLRASAMKTAAAQGHLQDLTESFNENKR